MTNISMRHAFDRLLAIATTVVVSILLAAIGLSAQQQKSSEYKVKATYIYNFARFVTWPATFSSGKDEAFTVCVLGHDPFGPTLDSTLGNETLDGKPVTIKRISKPQDSAGCRILFISSTEESHLKDILTALDEQGALTVSDMPDFTRRGGMIQFVPEGDRIRFEVNLTSAESSKLVLSSELLKVASNVNRNARVGEN